jgi:hypothetical protein
VAKSLGEHWSVGAFLSVSTSTTTTSSSSNRRLHEHDVFPTRSRRGGSSPSSTG